MDIALAKQTIATAIKTRADEMAALQAATDLLNSTFTAEFTNLTLAQSEATDLASKLSEEKTAHESTTTDLKTAQTMVATLQAEKDAPAPAPKPIDSDDPTPEA